MVEEKTGQVSRVVLGSFSQRGILEAFISIIFFSLNPHKIIKNSAGSFVSYLSPSAKAAEILRNIPGTTDDKYLKENCSCKMLAYILVVTFQVLADTETTIPSNRGVCALFDFSTCQWKLWSATSLPSESEAEIPRLDFSFLGGGSGTYVIKLGHKERIISSLN